MFRFSRKRTKIICIDNSIYFEDFLTSKKESKCFKKNNLIDLGNSVSLKKCVFRFFGEKNTIRIGHNCKLNETEIWIEGSNNNVYIGNGVSFCGKTHIAVIEGTRLKIGDNCLFSSDIQFRTGDSHSILDSSKKRINISKDIYIGNNVWIGTRVLVLKGSSIPNDCVIGAGSVITKSFCDTNCIIAGNPASIKKTNIFWERERL